MDASWGDNIFGAKMEFFRVHFHN